MSTLDGIIASGGSGGAGGSGDVVGPASSTDNAIARFDGATGKLLQNSGVTVADGLTGGVIVGSTGATDNAILAADGTGGATLQARDLTVSDVSGGVVTLATTAGNALAIANTNPAATTGASVAGDPLTITAGSAVASTDTAGAAAGGDITITAGNAARLTSGNANGGSISLSTGSGIGTGGTGSVSIPNGGSATYPALLIGSYVGLSEINNGYDGNTFALSRNGTAYEENFYANSYYFKQLSSTAGHLVFGRPAEGVGLRQNPPKTLLVTDSYSGVGSLLNAVLVEANTAGSGTPNAIGAVESGTVFTNEGSGAKNYEALPTAVAGYQFTFIVQDADGMRIVANTGDTIRVIDKVTAAAGYIESTTIGSVVTLIAINATEWIATSIHGTWTDGTFTYDDTGLTSP